MDDSRRFTLIQLAGWNTKNGWPTFTCRHCGSKSQKVTNLNSAESAESVSLREHDSWEPEWIGGNFTAISTCKKCSDKVYMVGIYKLNEFYNDYDELSAPKMDYEELFLIKYMTPSIKLLNVPKNCPDKITKIIDSAGEVFFASPDLAANRIRNSIDELLNDQKVPRHKKDKGKLIKLSTHNRIIQFSKNKQEIGNLLQAVKWIGNEGSHQSILSISNVIDGLEIYSLALSLLYDNGSATIRKKAALINKNRGIKKGPVPF